MVILLTVMYILDVSIQMTESTPTRTTYERLLQERNRTRDSYTTLTRRRI